MSIEQAPRSFIDIASEAASIAALEAEFSTAKPPRLRVGSVACSGQQLCGPEVAGIIMDYADAGIIIEHHAMRLISLNHRGGQNR